MTYVIGTAGHVDHGKSTLVERLTGIDPDRLAEEKEREMTIDLGFAWLTLPSGQSVGIVDVPGHRDFIENMLAGVGGIDAALFVVAADEGIMPQTREHLAILDLLSVQGGVVALTKTDLAEDEEWLQLVSADVDEVLAGTVLGGAPVVPVSARTGEGIEALLAALDGILGQRPPRPDLGRPRLPIDRVFSMSGFGTVVTGTLVDGSIAVGDDIEVQPRGLKARVRGIQSHKQKVEVAQPGSRVALNLVGVDVHDLKRGDVVAAPGTLASTELIDVQFKHLADANRPLKHNAEVKLFVGAAEVVAHVRLLGTEQLAPGESGWLQLRLAQPVAVGKGDRFILRYPSPGQTVGGGDVLDANPQSRWRRFRPESVERLETLAAGTPDEVAEQTLDAAPSGLTVAGMAEGAGMTQDEAAQALDLLLSEGRALVVGDGLAFSRGAWGRLMKAAGHTLADYHSQYPLRMGMPREELRSRIQLDSKVFSAVVASAGQSGEIAEAGEGAWLRLPEHEVVLSDERQRHVNSLLDQFAANPATPPSYKEAVAQVGDELMQMLLTGGDLVAVSGDVVFDTGTYHEMVGVVRSHLVEQGSITVAEARDLFNTSRKYALALLEHLDQVGVTKRVGDERVLGRAG
jgi:selenocysteine-specific elongation factor